MRIPLTVLATLFAISACDLIRTPLNSDPQPTPVESPAAPTAQDIAAETARLNAWFEDKYEAELLTSPIQLTFQGRSERQGEIDDMSEASVDARLARSRANLSELEQGFEYDLLSADAKVSYDIWVYQAERLETEDAFRYNTYVFDQMQAIHAYFPQILISFHAVNDAGDMDNYLSRISESARALEQLIESSRKVAERGTRPPYFAYDEVIKSSREIIAGAPFDDSGSDSDIWADAQAKIANLQDQGKLDQTKADQLTRDIRAALVDQWLPAYQNLIAWQEEDRPNASAVAQGASALPNGAAYYDSQIARYTTTDLSADQIHLIGLENVARLRAEMETIRARFGFEGSLQDFFEFLRISKDDERFYYPDTDQGRQAYLDDSTAAIDGIKTALPDYFGVLPKADLVVRRVEPFREQDGAAQHYYPGSPDGSRPGVYYVHLSDMAAMPKYEMEVIAYHEGIPGHHMQNTIQQEIEDLPTFRQQANFGVYGEGWGLYAERLAMEMPNTYPDDISNFGRAGSEMWRAVRLVVDTGLHAKGWTEDEAVQYFLDNAPITEAQARSEVQRYLVLPGQATSYQIGLLKIWELRQNAETILGDRFDIRGFHDTVLSGGSMPLVILERRVDEWIATVQAG